MSVRLRRGFLLATAMALPLAFSPMPLSGARAADVTQAQAQDVAKQLQDWMIAMLGGQVPVPPNLIKVEPAGQ